MKRCFVVICLEFPEHSSSPSSTNRLTWKHSICPFISSSSLRCPGDNSKFVPEWLQNYLDRNLIVNGWNASLVTCCNQPRGCKILHKVPEGDGFHISSKTNSNMLQGIPGWLLVIAESKILFRVFAELTYLGINEYTHLNLPTKPWEFLTQEWKCWTISV